MIPTKYKGTDLIGKKARAVCQIRNGAGDGLDIGAIVTIVEVVRGHGFNIQSETCPCCKQFCYIRHVSRADLELLERGGDDESAERSLSAE